MISVPGLGSGLDVNSIVSQLISVEGDTKTLLLGNQQNEIQSEISAFGSLKSLLSTFQTTASKLKLPTTFNASLAASSKTDVFTASTSGLVSAGEFDIEVRSLAEAHKLLSPGFADADTSVGEGVLNISLGADSFSVNIDSSNDTLNGIRDAINDATDNTGVNATVATVDDGTGTGTLTKLILSSASSGGDNTITVSVVDSGDGNHTDANGLSALYYDTSDGTTPEQLTQINAAADAEIYVDGQRVFSSSNTVVNVIEGITLNLLSEDSGTTHTLTITDDAATIKADLELFVSNYNSFILLTNNLTSFDTETGNAGIFLGDATVRTLRNQVRNEISNAVTDIGGPFSMLVDIGITTQSDGSLSIDSAELDAALNSNFDDVASLFSSTNGIAVRLDGVINEYTKADGIIDGKTQGLNSTIDSIEEEFQDLNDTLDALEERLLAQFAGLDVLVSQLNSTSNFLTQQFQIIGNIFDQQP